ncbi:transposase [Scytonema hofmannii PCC 7110]|uniref:Transposase n=1 Tax=Scytonema hofmannii PCC 7110 TaxID=128403 RepID=A0A139X2A1_9CYAN|nr:transposase [Scytonema hofmannii PCC 7110]
MCQQYGINYVETEEAYTSRASFLDGDLVPAFGERPEGYKFSGKRTKRGEYTSKKGIKCNADLNGSANILVKVATRLGLDLSQIGRGCLTQPVRFYA